MNNTEDKIFFQPGEVVTIKQDIPNKPVMVVVKKETRTFKIDTHDDKKSDYFLGIKCRWFTENGFLQEAVWNTKDLCKVE